jgi:two-component system KDP operon response regulator KdpE
MMLNNSKILLIEDDLQTRRFLKKNLNARGWEVSDTASGKEGLILLKDTTPNLLILDLGLPDMDGISLIKHLRQFSNIPILVLSARSLEQSKMSALDAGADDYLTKPFGIGELNSRLQALIRRINQTPINQDIFETGELKIDLSKRQVFVSQKEIKITPTEYHILYILIQHAGLVVTHRYLLKNVWGMQHLDNQHYLRIYMRRLRHKIEENPTQPRYLLTETGVGYRLLNNTI